MIYFLHVTFSIDLSTDDEVHKTGKYKCSILIVSYLDLADSYNFFTKSKNKVFISLNLRVHERQRLVYCCVSGLHGRLYQVTVQEVLWSLWNTSKWNMGKR